MVLSPIKAIKKRVTVALSTIVYSPIELNQLNTKMPPMKSGHNWFIGGLQLTVLWIQLEATKTMSEDFDYVKDILLKPDNYIGYKPTPHPLPDLVAAIDAADRIDDARILTSIALSQVKEEYASGDTVHKLVIMLQTIQGILEVATEDLQCNLERCQTKLRKQIEV